jgi:hypothetical protein
MKNNSKKFPLPTGDEWFRLPERVSKVEDLQEQFNNTPVPEELPYKIYRAAFIQNAQGAQAITVFENTLGGNVRIEDNFGTGFSLVTSGLFTNLKTFVKSVTYQANGQVYNFYPTIDSTSQISWQGRRTSDNSSSVPFSNNPFYLEIIVYK